jgi:hypothetical protein
MKVLTISNQRLPRGWRKRICETLNNQGFQLHEQKISDIIRGRYSDDSLTNAVLKEYRKAIRKSQKRKATLKAGKR